MNGQIKLSAPSIPSKLLSPFIDRNENEKRANVVIPHEFCQFSKMIDDPSRVGPGSYNVAGVLDGQTKLITTWKTSPPELERNSLGFLKIDNPGPGAYEISETNKQLKTMSIARNGLRNRKILHNNGSIKSDFVDFDDEIDLDSHLKNPGPGHYNNEPVTVARPRSLLTFGTASRFQRNTQGSSLGPGHYKTDNRAKTVLGASYNFKSTGRKEAFNSLSADLPGPGEYY